MNFKDITGQRFGKLVVLGRGEDAVSKSGRHRIRWECKWVISVVQANNRRSNNLITYNGETLTVTEWAEKLGKNPKTIFNRLYSGWSPIEAITK